MMNKFKDCSVVYENGIVNISNKRVSRDFDVSSGTFLTFCDRVSGRSYVGSTKISCPPIDISSSEISVNSDTDTNLGLSEEFFRVSISYAYKGRTLTISFELFPDSPFIMTKMKLVTDGGCFVPEIEVAKNAFDFERSQILDSINFSGKHVKMTAYELFDHSDVNAEPVHKSEYAVYPTAKHDYNGNVFLVKEYMRGDSIMLVKNSPVYQSHLNPTSCDLRVDNQNYMLCGTGVNYRALDAGEIDLYSSAIGVGTELLKEYKALCRKLNRGIGTLFAMENTWGDRSEEKKLCDSFIMGEIDAASRIGADFVQIDDGWAKGTVDTKNGFINHVWEGYHSADSDYWKVSETKFPNGFAALGEYAKSKNVGLGLWFSPDSDGEFAHRQEDADILYGFYRDCGIKYFKLDGINVRSKTAEHRFVEMLRDVTERSGGEVTFQLDVTAGMRFGFLYHREFGTLFVENRYTDFGNYFPHTTLRSLWQLAEIFPARDFQFEFLNHRRNAASYTADPLAPGLYDIDYLFAVTMLANPLVWMEMTSLDARDIPLLTDIMQVWRAHRDALYHADVIPIGDEPDGESFTGFYVDCNSQSGYVLLFREVSRYNEYVYHIPSLAGKKFNMEPLASGGGISLTSDISGIKARFDAPRSYIFAKITIY